MQAVSHYNIGQLMPASQLKEMELFLNETVGITSLFCPYFCAAHSNASDLIKLLPLTIFVVAINIVNGKFGSLDKKRKAATSRYESPPIMNTSSTGFASGLSRYSLEVEMFSIVDPGFAETPTTAAAAATTEVSAVEV